jgi:hypothetical protein
MPVDFAEILPTQAATAAAATTVKNVALFLAAPFIGLVYAMALPFVGLAMLAWIGGKALVKAPAAYQAMLAVKDVALFVAAPFIGLVYAVTLPFVGTALIARAAYKAYRA